MASETCTTIIIHPGFKPNSPLESRFETTSYEQDELDNQSASDTSTSVSEDQTFNVQPVHAAKPEAVINSSNLDYTSFFNSQANSILEPVIEQIFNPTSAETSDNMLLYDSDEEDEHFIHIERDLDSFSASVIS